MIIALLRVTGSAFESRRKAIEPSPWPCAPEVITNQGAALAAVHEHSRETVTLTALVPPLAANDRGVASKLGWQRAAVADGAVTLVDVDPPQAATSVLTLNAMDARRIAGSCGTARYGCISVASRGGANRTRVH